MHRAPSAGRAHRAIALAAIPTPILTGAFAAAPAVAATTTTAASSAQTFTDVAVSGTATVGSTLTATVTEWDSPTAPTYQWVADDVPIAGATASTFTLTPAQDGRTIAVRAVRPDGSWAGSTPTSRVLTVGTVAVTGTPQAGRPLTVATTGWSPTAELAYSWNIDGISATEKYPGVDAFGTTFTPTAAMAGARISVEVSTTGAPFSASGYPFAKATKQSAATSRVVGATAPTITGALTPGQTVTATTAGWPAGATFTYQWFAGGAAVPGATAATFSVVAAHVGQSLRVNVTGAAPEYTTTTVSSADTAKVTPSGVPTISGTPLNGNRLTAVPGTWPADAVLSYQWYADGEVIPGATASSTPMQAMYDGKALTVAVTATRPGFATVTRVSAPTLRALIANMPNVTGDHGTGLTLTAVPSVTTTGTTSTFQWYADGVAVSGATAATFTLTTAQANKKMTVRVTTTKAGHATATFTSTPGFKVILTGALYVSGTRAVGSTLTAVTGTWTPNTTFTYRWFADGVAISGATGRTYTATAATANKKLTVAVRGTANGYSNATRTSPSTAKIATAPIPKISGTLKVASTLEATAGTWSPGTTLTYQWYANGVAITNANGTSFKLTSAQRGKTITVRVTGTATGYNSISRTTAATAKIG